jgi:zinc D-Ala-D-Ala dipeptidase
MERRSILKGLLASPLVGSALAGCRNASPNNNGSQSDPTAQRKSAALVRHQKSAESGAYFAQYGLVDLLYLHPSLNFDIRYATPNNFTGQKLYGSARAFLVPAAADALMAAHWAAYDEGYGLTVFDAYRPLSVTRKMWAATPRRLRNYVANPAKGSRHNRGCAVDVTLYDRATKQSVLMPSEFDDFSAKAHRNYAAAPQQALANRARLERYMVAAGFRPMSNEWWHFDFIGWEKYPILDVPFEKMVLTNGEEIGFD